MITADFCILPMGIEGTEIGEYVTKAVEIIEKSGLNYQLTAMGTQIETDDLKKLYEVCGEVQEAIFEMGCGRVYSVLKIDDRRDKENRTLEAKIKTVEDKMRENKK
ncbi:MAG: MTH1187 family thiamine-binding protein [Methanobrevibacter sp.]|nr:MTH1187 family thiamine-binding protein [Methanobrevibacter sp.]